MTDICFEWDQEKASLNIDKHGVSFEQAKSVFWDEHALFLRDEGHSEDEERYWLLGLDSSMRELVVCHCFRSNDDVIRIISARKAEKREQRKYWKERTI